MDAIRDLFVRIDFDGINVRELLRIDEAVDKIEDSFRRVGGEVEDVTDATKELGGEALDTTAAFSQFGLIAGEVLDDLEDKVDDLEDEIDDVNQALRRASLSSVAFGGAITGAMAGGVAASAPLLMAAGAIGAAFATAGAGVAGFAVVATSALTNVFDAAKEVEKIQEKIATADTWKEQMEAQKELEALYSGMSDAQRDALEGLLDFKQFWADFVAEFEEPIFEAFAETLNATKTLLKALEPTIGSVAELFVDLAGEMNRAFQSPAMVGFFDWLASDAAQSISDWTHIFANFAGGALLMLQAFDPVMDDMNSGILYMSHSFKDWAESLGESDAFKDFVEYAKRNGPVLMDVFGNLLDIIGDVFVALAPLGELVLDILELVTDVVSDLTTNLGGIFGGIVSFGDEIKAILAGAMDFLVGIFEENGGHIARTFSDLKDAITSVLDFLGVLWAAWGDDITAIVSNALSTVFAVASGALDLITDIFKLATSVLTGDWSGAMDAIRDLFGNLLGNLLNAGREALALLNSAFQLGMEDVLAYLGSIDLVQYGKDIINGLIDGMASMWDQAVEYARSMATDIQQAFVDLFDIHSPSRVMAEIGRDISEGLTIGIDKNAQSAIDAAYRMGEGVNNVVDLEAYKQAKSAMPAQTRSDGSIAPATPRIGGNVPVFSPQITIRIDGVISDPQETANIAAAAARREMQKFWDEMLAKMA